MLPALPVRGGATILLWSPLSLNRWSFTGLPQIFAWLMGVPYAGSIGRDPTQFRKRTSSLVSSHLEFGDVRLKRFRGLAVLRSFQGGDGAL